MGVGTAVHIGHKNIEPQSERFYGRYNYLAFYENILGQRLVEKKYPYYVAFCPFHKDVKTANYYINIISGRGHCWACSATREAYHFVMMEKPDGSMVYHFPDTLNDELELQRVLSYERDDSAKKEASELVLALEDRRAIKSHEFLFRQPFALQRLQRDRGLTLESINRWKIGYMQGVVTIPIYDILGKIASLKFHKKFQTEGAKNQLFPWEAVLGREIKDIILVEGEFDMMLLRQFGFNAVTQTAGANSWNPEFNQFFHKKHVYIAYDNDEAGKNGAMLVGESLWKDRVDVNFVQWPEFMGEKEDHVDFFVKYRKDATDYRRLLKTAINITRR
jgi:DNA primase